MKYHLTIILLLLSFQPIFSQWKYKSGGNAFDGTYRTSYVIGKGNDFPYNKPQLVVNAFENKTLNFYLSDAGYFNGDYVDVLWAFNNESNNIYISNVTISDDNETIFFNSFTNTTNGQGYNKLEFIEKLKKASKVDLRVKYGSGQRDFSFSLSGSTKAINYVINKEFKDNLNNVQRELEFLRKKTDSLDLAYKYLVEKQKYRIDSLITTKYSLTKTDSLLIRKSHASIINEKTFFKIQDADLIVMTEDLFMIEYKNFEEKTIKTIYRVKLPDYGKKLRAELEQKKREEDKARIEEEEKILSEFYKKIDDFLSKHPFTPEQKEIIRSDIYSFFNNKGNLDFNQLGKIEMIKAKRSFKALNLNLYNINGSYLKTFYINDTYLSRKYINKYPVKG